MFALDISETEQNKIVNLKLCIDLLVNLLKEEFQKWIQTNNHADSLLSCLLSQLKSVNGKLKVQVLENKLFELQLA